MCFAIEEIQEEIFGQYADDWAIETLNQPSSRCQVPEIDYAADSRVLQSANLGLHSTCGWLEL